MTDETQNPEATTPETPETVVETITPSSPTPAGNTPEENASTAPASAPAAHQPNFLERIGEDIETGVVDIGKFVKDLPQIIKAWNTLSPEVKALATQIFHDVMTIVTDGVAEVGDIKGMQVAPAITLGEQTWAAIQQLITDVEAGDKELAASLKVLGITL